MCGGVGDDGPEEEGDGDFEGDDHERVFADTAADETGDGLEDEGKAVRDEFAEPEGEPDDFNPNEEAKEADLAS